MTDKTSTIALRAKARKQGCRITVKVGMAQLLEYNSNVDCWLAADNYWGVLSHPWTYREVLDMRTQRAQLEIGQLWLACFVWTQKSSFRFLRFDNDHFMMTSSVLPLDIHRCLT